MFQSSQQSSPDPFAAINSAYIQIDIPRIIESVGRGGGGSASSTQAVAELKELLDALERNAAIEKAAMKRKFALRKEPILEALQSR